EVPIAGFLRQWKRHLELAFIGFRIIDRHFVSEFVRTDPCKAFGQLERIAGRHSATIKTNAGFASEEIRSLHDKRVSLPVPARIAHIGAEVWTGVGTSVQRNHSSFMDHLLKNRHVAWSLNDFLPIPIDNRQDRSRDTTTDTPDVVAE